MLQSDAMDGKHQHVCGTELENAAPVPVYIAIVREAQDFVAHPAAQTLCSWATRLLQSEATDGQQQHVRGSQLENAAPVPVYVAIARRWQSVRDRGPRASMDVSLLLLLLL